MTLDFRRYRAETPAVTHGRIHLNNAGASLMPLPVIEAVRHHLDREVQLGGYEAADTAAEQVAQAYADVGSVIGAAARNIAVVENATVAFSQALSAFDFTHGDVILTSSNDYISNQLAYLSLARRTGVEVQRVADMPEGGVDPDAVRAAVARRRPALVAITWVPTSSGLVQPVAEIGRVCRDADVPYLVDACQAVGQLEVDVQAIGCDFLAATARKFLRGPRGVGFLYVSDRMLEQQRAPLHVDMRGAEWITADDYRLADSAMRFENWEFAYALLLGMGAAARYAQEVGIAAAGARAAELAAYARRQLAGLQRVRVLDHGTRLCAIVTAEIGDANAPEVVRRLREQAINTSAIIREHAVIDFDDKQATSALRVSPHYFNTEREIDIAVGAIGEFVPA